MTIFETLYRNFEILEFFYLSKIRSWNNDTSWLDLSKNLRILPRDPWLPRCSKNLARSCHGIHDAGKMVNPGHYRTATTHIKRQLISGDNSYQFEKATTHIKLQLRSNKTHIRKSKST